MRAQAKKRRRYTFDEGWWEIGRAGGTVEEVFNSTGCRQPRNSPVGAIGVLDNYSSIKILTLPIGGVQISVVPPAAATP